MKSFLTLIICLFTWMSFAQNKGYFGQKNILTVHGSAFLRGIPQSFYESSKNIYVYQEGESELQRNRVNMIWNAGITYRHITGRSSAIGLRYDFGTRKISSPFDALNVYNGTLLSGSKPYFQPLYGIQNFYPYQAENSYSSDEDIAVPQLNWVKSTATYVSVNSLSLVYSRNKTFSFMPLGVVSTLGIGIQSIAMQTNKDAYLYYNYITEFAGNSYFASQIEKLSPPPVNFTNKYWGFLASWDLSINYPISKNLILEFASELRSTFRVKWRSDVFEQRTFFPKKTGNAVGELPLESTFYARDMTYELRREMFFNNTFRLGLTFMF